MTQAREELIMIIRKVACGYALASDKAQALSGHSDKSLRGMSKMEKSTLVSIIIPVFNTASYLPQTLDSVLHQTYEKLEILVIDDGSTDESGNICDDYSRKDRRLRVIHTENKGLSVARNMGMKHAEGVFVSFVDSDDWIEPQTIEILLSTAVQTNADVVVAASITEYVDRSVHNLQAEDKVVLLQGQDILSAYVDGRLRDVVWNKLFSNSCLDLLQFPEGHNYEDVVVTVRLMKHLSEHGGVVAKISDELFHQRVRKTSISHTRTFSTVVDCWCAYRDKFDELPIYQKQLIPGCIGAIGKMWPNYGGFSKEEKEKAITTIMEMQDFSRSHCRQIMRGNYNRYIKRTCLISQSRSKLLMWFFYHGGRFFRILRNSEKMMFD